MLHSLYKTFSEPLQLSLVARRDLVFFVLGLRRADSREEGNYQQCKDGAEHHFDFGFRTADCRFT
jgi:hypothetical protein